MAQVLSLRRLLCVCLLVRDVAAWTSDVGLEPGHVGDVFETFEEVNSHENVTTVEKTVEDERLLKEAILDVAYYLRRFKFWGFDPRYLGRQGTPNPNQFKEFPSPPLRNIHWKVKKNCEPSFQECVTYLQDVVSRTVLPRHLDSLTIVRRNRWSLNSDSDLVKAADEECLKLLEKDGKTFVVFSGPIERFQWLASASYYMCHFTALEIPLLKMFAEECNDFASCIPWELGPFSKDFRADNRRPFACALYSFCPDPCCPVKYAADPSACSAVNPCAPRSTSSPCVFHTHENTNFDAITLNQWNISCVCEASGMRWDSKSGMCIDVDECKELEAPCNYPFETCRNLPGSYKCVCSPMGYHNNSKNEGCEQEPVLHAVLYPPPLFSENETKSVSDKIHDVFTKVKSFVLKKKEEDGSTSDESPPENKTQTDLTRR